MRATRQIIRNGEDMNTMASQYRAAKLEHLTAELGLLKAQLSNCQTQNKSDEIKNLFARAKEDLFIAHISILEVRIKLLELGEV